MTVSMIAPAFPKIVEALGVSAQTVGLLITAYTLPSFIIGPLAGIMADRLGRRRLFVPCLFLFGILGGACAFAPNFQILVILRILQGIFGAPLGGISGAIVGDLFSGQRRAEAMGLNTTVGYTGYVIYPLIGGALAGLAWNYPFLCYLLAIPVGVLAFFFLHPPEPKRQQKLREYLGSGLRYLKSLKVLWLFSAALITYIMLYGAYLTYFGIRLRQVFNATPLTIGLFISFVGLVTSITSSQVGRLSKRFSAISLIIAAFVIYAVAVALIPAISNLWLCLLPSVLFGIGHGINLPNQRVIAATVTPMEHRAGFMAIQGAIWQLGMAIAPVILGLVFTLTNLSATFLIAAAISAIIPTMALIIGKAKLGSGQLI